MPTKDIQQKKNGRNILISVFVTLFFTPIIEKMLTNTYNEAVHKLFSTGNTFILFISSFFYSRISEGVYVNIPFYIFIVIISCILIKFVRPCIPNRFPCGVKKIESCGKKSSCGLSRRTKCVILSAIKHPRVKSFSFIVIYILFVLFLLTTNFVNKTITRTTNNIEIVSPYISDEEYKMLKSDFHSMKTRNDYDEIIDSLEKISEQYQIELK